MRSKQTMVRLPRKMLDNNEEYLQLLRVSMHPHVVDATIRADNDTKSTSTSRWIDEAYSILSRLQVSKQHNHSRSKQNQQPNSSFFSNSLSIEDSETDEKEFYVQSTMKPKKTMGSTRARQRQLPDQILNALCDENGSAPLPP